MPLTSRKKRPLDRPTGVLRDARLIVIATEGEQTERRYFEIFRNSKIQIRVIPTVGGESAPEYVLKRLDGYRDEFEIGEDDELWLMIDVDRWGDSKLSQIARLCTQKKYGLAVSNPCFELWLYLHFVELEPNSDLGSCKEIENLLKAVSGGYHKSNLKPEVFKPHISDAIERAKKLHLNRKERYPSATGSHVYKIAEKLLK